MRYALVHIRAAVCALAAALVLSVAHARGPADALPEVRVRDLPEEARQVLVLIQRGGPFTHDRDGVVFGNRERVLPDRARGYYREYTVRTPRERSRGARRIVCGGPPSAPDACFYTSDHYQSFQRIRL
jgi:ribonuclease T1